MRPVFSLVLPVIVVDPGFPSRSLCQAFAHSQLPVASRPTVIVSTQFVSGSVAPS